MSLYGCKLDVSRIPLHELIGDEPEVLDLNIYLNCLADIDSTMKDFTVRYDGNDYHLLYIGYHRFVQTLGVQDTYKDILEMFRQPFTPLVEYTFSPVTR